MKHIKLMIIMLITSLIMPGSTIAQSQRTVDLPEFDAIEIEGLAVLTVVVGEEQSVTVTARRESYLDNIEFEVRNRVLEIDMEGTFLRSPEFEISITVENLTSLAVEGIIEARITGVDADEFIIDMEGAGDILLTGRCGVLRADMEGASDLEARNLICEDVYVDAEGATDVRVHATHSIEADANGMGDIIVYGNPSIVRPTVSGMGSFRIIDER